jgi:UDP-glucose:(heptosyl)LPS alpha-1,3-glucosyltransferase
MKLGPLKIAIVRPSFTINKGGAERYALELARGLSRAGHEVHAFAYDWDKPEQPGVTYHHVPMARKPAWLRVLLFHFNLRRRLRLADYDGVIGLTPFWPQHVFWLGDGLFRLWVRIAWPRPLMRSVMCLHRAVMAVKLRMEKIILTAPGAIFIANSKLVARQAAQLYGISRQRIRIIYPWLDQRRFNPQVRGRWRAVTRHELGIEDGEIALCFAAHNFKRKGLPLVLDALAHIGRSGPPLRLIVIGAGRIARFRRAATRLGLAERVILVGAVADIERYYAAADIFVLPTRYDPCATVCLEAMACGLPVITTEMNGAAEFIEQEDSGFILNANPSADSLALSIRSLASHDRCRRAGAKAYERVSYLSAPGHLQRVISLIQQCARTGETTEAVRMGRNLVVNRRFTAMLRSYGLTHFSALLATPQRKEIEYNRKKRISLLCLGEGRERCYFFLKYHRERRSWLRVLAGKFGDRRKSEGMTEWRNLLAFQSAGIPTATPVAAGERRLPDGGRESFVMTARLEGYVPLDQYIAAQFAAPLTPLQLREKRRLIRAVAELARRMHAAQFNHRDFYLCHIFVKPGAVGSPDVKIIDLQRVGYRSFPAQRWRVKDIAQLHYSSLTLPVSPLDRCRFFCTYLAPTVDAHKRRRMLSRVLIKSARIAAHDAKLRQRDSTLAWSDPFAVSTALTHDAAGDETLR